MKYVRTRENVYEFLYTTHNGFELSYHCKSKESGNGYEVEIKEHEVYRTGNSIEELVDGYFVHDNGYSAEFHRSNIAKRTKGIYYAFIYVDEEPKVVAVWHKEKKEWELL